MTRFTRSFVMTTLIALSACAIAPSSGPEIENWRSVVLVENPPLPVVTVSLPPGFSVTSGHGIDSAVAQITGPGITINADYGRAGMQSCGNLPECRQASATIDGRPATWVRFPRHATFGGQSYSERLDFAVKLRPSQDPRLGPTAGLMLVAVCSTTAECDIAEQISRSVKFSQPPR